MITEFHFKPFIDVSFYGTILASANHNFYCLLVLYISFRHNAFFCKTTLNIVNALVDVETLRIVIKSRAFYQANNFVVVLHCRYLLTEIIGMYT